MRFCCIYTKKNIVQQGTFTRQKVSLICHFMCLEVIRISELFPVPCVDERERLFFFLLEADIDWDQVQALDYPDP